MRTQTRPFVVEIRKTKRAEKATEPAAAEPAASRLWDMPTPREETLSPSAARRAADALFQIPPAAAQPAAAPSAAEEAERLFRKDVAQEPRQDASASAPRQAAPSPEATPAAPGKGRILWAEAQQAVDEAPSVEARAAETPVEPAPAKSAQGKPRDSAPRKRTPGSATPTLQTTAKSAAKSTAKPPRARVSEPPVDMVDAVEAVVEMPAPETMVAEAVEATAPTRAGAAPARSLTLRRRNSEFAPGERWKRRLPKALR